MGHKFDLFRRVAVRFLIASPLFFIQVFLIYWWPGFGVIAGLPFGFGGALIVLPRLLDLLSEPFRALFYPLERLSKPVPMYSVPKAKRARGAYSDALQDYEIMERKYPGDMEIYRNMLELLVLEIKDPEKASDVFQRALISLKKTEEREGLARVYEGILSQVKGKPDWFKLQQDRKLAAAKGSGDPVKEPDGFAARRFHSGGHYRNGD